MIPLAVGARELPRLRPLSGTEPRQQIIPGSVCFDHPAAPVVALSEQSASDRQSGHATRPPAFEPSNVEKMPLISMYERLALNV
jgi:hypothetical protein